MVLKNSRDNGEQQLQIALFNWLEHACPNLLAWAVPNGGKRDIIEAALLKKQGVKAGVSDVHILHDFKLHWMELKNPSGRGVLSDTQKGFGEAVVRQGGKFGVAKSGDEIMALFDEWGILYRFKFPIIGDGNKKMVRFNAYHAAMLEASRDRD